MEWTVDNWIQNVSLGASVLIAVVLLLFLVGKKIAYLKKIILGVEALRTHRMDYKIPLEGNNEFTELAETINYLSKTELELKEKEERLQSEKENFIRSLSHDIRTPLTSILSYSEYMNSKDTITSDEVKEYASLIQKKAQQIKTLTDQLLDGQNHTPEHFENGRFLFEQLAEEWETSLEDDFHYEIDFTECQEFSGEFDVLELQRIFDNLSSNIEKYADANHTVTLKFSTIKTSVNEKQLIIEQKNVCKTDTSTAESNKIGLENIRRITSRYNGDIHTNLTSEEFIIQIIFRNII